MQAVRLMGGVFVFCFRIMSPSQRPTTIYRRPIFPLTIQALYEAKGNGHIRHELTETQRDTLVEAFNAGYFEVPREESLTGVSEQLTVSH